MAKDRKEEYSIERLPTTRVEFVFERPQRSGVVGAPERRVITMVVCSIPAVLALAVALIVALLVGRLSEELFAATFVPCLTVLALACRLARKAVRKR